MLAICNSLSKPDREDEIARIKADGGRVFNWNGWRVLGVLHFKVQEGIGSALALPNVSRLHPSGCAFLRSLLAQVVVAKTLGSIALSLLGHKALEHGLLQISLRKHSLLPFCGVPTRVDRPVPALPAASKLQRLRRQWLRSGMACKALLYPSSRGAMSDAYVAALRLTPEAAKAMHGLQGPSLLHHPPDPVT
ncbi:hypothetical protein L7F22_003860 [Adiantum nelumboides]|nr:hypothetical protein [Adiantum nelumboides]